MGDYIFQILKHFKNFTIKHKLNLKNEVSLLLENNFYSKDFYSLVPIFNERSEQLYGEKHIKFIQKKFSSFSSVDGKAVSTSTVQDIMEHFDSLEEIVGEDVFESFLNSEAEIQVGNKIYKYTDQGIFIATLDSYDKIAVFMNNNDAKSLGDIENIKPLDYQLLYNPNGGLVEIEEGLEHYIPEGYNKGGGFGDGGNSGGFDPQDGSGDNGSGGSGGSENYGQIANTLSSCNITSPWFANIFGTVKVCTDKYQSDKRVKTKYYSVDLFLGYAIGVKVKNQKKGWTGLWRKEDTNKVVLGVNSLSWKFNHTNDFSQIWDNSASARYYLHDGKAYSTLNGYYNAVYMGNIEMPNLPFKNKVDVIVEVAIHNGVFNSEKEVRTFFYSNLFNGLKSFMENQQNKQLKNAGIVIVTPTANWIQFYNFERDCSNCDKLEHIIDWGVGTPVVTYNFGSGSSSGSFKITNWEVNFKTPSLVGMSAFGMAKKGGSWHGNKIEF